MAALPENDRIAGPFLAVAGQVDFPADFPLIKAEGLRVRRERGGVSTVLEPPAVTAVNVTEGAFTARLAAPALVGDRLFVFSELPPARMRSHAPNGAVRTPTLEGDAVELQAQLQEVRRNAGRTLCAPVGEAGVELPSALDRPGNGLFWDADDKPYWGLPFTGGPISAFFQGVIQSATAAVALSLLGIKTPGGFGAKGDGVADDTVAMKAAAASGERIWLQGRTYKVREPLRLASGTRFEGPGEVVAAADFSGSWIIEVMGGARSALRRVGVDGAALGAATLYGVRVEGNTVDLVIEHCRIRNLGFTGIDVSAGGGGSTHLRPTVRCNLVENVGWTGINIDNPTEGLIEGNAVRRTGYHGIFLTRAKNTVVHGNRISKATAPDHIYGGPGSLGGVEGGFMIGYEPGVDRLTISGNVCDDNRNAHYDGIGVGEDGVTEFGSVIITGNFVRRAGLFGIDPTGNVIVTSNFIDEAAEQGIHVGLDLGGLIRNVLVADNIVRNTGDTPGKYAMLVGDTLGPPIAMRDVRFTNNIVIDDRAVKNTAYGLGVVCDEATYEGLSVVGNDLSRVATASITIFGANGPGADYEAWGNKVIGDERIAWTPVVTSATGALTTATASGRFQRVGKTIQLRGRVQITAHGTGAGALNITLPVPVRSGTTFAMTAMAGNGAEVLYAAAVDGTLVLAKSGGATAIASGADLFFNGSYEAAA